jgi:hypothetical protein
MREGIVGQAGVEVQVAAAVEGFFSEGGFVGSAMKRSRSILRMWGCYGTF